MLAGKILFSWPSILFHTAWFVIWVGFGLDINLLTLIVSLEAIYITLLIGRATSDLSEHHAILKELKKELIKKHERVKEKLD